MKKSLKIVLIVLGVFICIIFLDTIQAIIFNNQPFIKVRENIKDEVVDKGLVINHYKCSNNEATLFKWIKYSCPTIQVSNPTKKVFLDNNISLSIPDTWEVENKEKQVNIYPDINNKEEYFYGIVDKNFGLCGTGVTLENYKYNNGKNATIAYTINTGIWEWMVAEIEDDKKVLFSNHNLKEKDALTTLEIIKNLN